MCAHFSGCAWHAIAKYEESIGISTTWLSKDVLNFEDAHSNITFQ